ncbi:MAG: hypothetical protein WCA98_01460 [Candidatus Acidiferrales bacterium]
MGAAVWLYGWLVLRQTRQEAGIGWVLGGKPVSYRKLKKRPASSGRRSSAGCAP